MGFVFKLNRKKDRVIFIGKNEDAHLSEVVDLFKDFLLGCGYYPGSIKKYFYCEEQEGEEKNVDG